MLKLRDKLLDYSHLILILTSILVYFLFSFLDVADGNVTVVDYSHYNWLNWLLFAGMIVLPTFVGLMINIGFRNLGYKRYRDDSEVKELYKKYYNLLRLEKKDKDVISTEEFMKRQNVKDSFVKTGIGLGTSFLVTNIILVADYSKVVGTIATLLMWVVLGFMSMIKLYDYGMSSGKEFLEKEIHRLSVETKEINLVYN